MTPSDFYGEAQLDAFVGLNMPYANDASQILGARCPVLLRIHASCADKHSNGNRHHQ